MAIKKNYPVEQNAVALNLKVVGLAPANIRFSLML
jgi:hypothetical protein